MGNMYTNSCKKSMHDKHENDYPYSMTCTWMKNFNMDKHQVIKMAKVKTCFMHNTNCDKIIKASERRLT